MLKAEKSHYWIAVLDSSKEFIIAHKNRKSQQFWLTFFVHTGDGDDWAKLNMPTPNYFHHTRIGYGYIVAWKIDSYFYTKKSKAFLEDVIERFLQTIPNSTRIPYAPKIRKTGFFRDGENKLSDIADCLPYIRRQSKGSQAVDLLNSIEKERNKGLADGKKHFVEDQLFELSRWHIYRKAYKDGIDSITLDYVTMIVQNENDCFRSPRESSAVRMKSKAIYKFMQEKFVLKGYSSWSKEDRAEYMRKYRRRKRKEEDMNRTEHMKKVHKNRNAKAQAKIRSVLEDMFVQDTIRFKNGKIRIGVVAKLVDMTAETVSKHLKEMKII